MITQSGATTRLTEVLFGFPPRRLDVNRLKRCDNFYKNMMATMEYKTKLKLKFSLTNRNFYVFLCKFYQSQRTQY